MGRDACASGEHQLSILAGSDPFELLKTIELREPECATIMFPWLGGFELFLIAENARTCPKCGRKCKNRRGVKIHMGQSHHPSRDTEYARARGYAEGFSEGMAHGLDRAYTIMGETLSGLWGPDDRT